MRLAVRQSRANSPFRQFTGSKKSTAAAVMAIVESRMFGEMVWSPGIVTLPKVFSERITQAKAVRQNTTAVSFSPRLIEPSPLRSPSMMFAASPERLPGGYRKRVSKIQVSGSITAVRGSPTPIHSTKPISVPRSSFAAPASTAFGGVPMSVETPPIDAAYATPSMSAIPNW